MKIFQVRTLKDSTKDGLFMYEIILCEGPIVFERVIFVCRKEIKDLNDLLSALQEKGKNSYLTNFEYLTSFMIRNDLEKTFIEFNGESTLIYPNGTYDKE